MATLETSGFKRLWEMKEFVGHDSQGRKVFREVFRDMKTGAIYAPENGWNGSPDAKAEQPVPSASESFRQNYDQIIWEPRLFRPAPSRI